MNKLWSVTLLAFALLSPVKAELDHLLSLQRKGDSGAYVSSGFHDWRTVSKYRSRPGLHAGYDIAMWAGSSVRAAWPGTVVAITPWFGSEYGVTVRSPNGYEATYGHITPSVTLGDRITAGDILGSVVVDHVDVKMTDTQGAYLDFQNLDLTFPDVEDSNNKDSPAVDNTEPRNKLATLKRELEQKERAFAHGLLPRKTVDELRNQVAALRKLTGDSSNSTSEVESIESTQVRSKADALVRRARPSKEVQKAAGKKESGGKVQKQQTEEYLWSVLPSHQTQKGKVDLSSGPKPTQSAP